LERDPVSEKMKTRFTPLFLVALLCLIIAPFVLGDYYSSLLTEILIWGLLAMSLDLLVGYTGIVSFGHAALFGLGAYGASMMIVRADAGLWLALLSGILVSGLLAVGVGILTLYLKGIFFTITTLVTAEIFHTIILAWTNFTGGENGLNFSVPSLSFFGWGSLDMMDERTFYYVVLFLAMGSLLLCRRLMASPFGRILRGIKENEERTQAIGFDVRRYKIMIFVISGLFAGLSGALYAFLDRYANPDFLQFIISGEAVIWTLVGGMGTLFGPMVGVAFVILLTDFLSTWIQNYLIIVGLIFVIAVIYLPKGIVGTIQEKFFGPRRIGRSKRVLPSDAL
jgi:branched-chain amino acid transport system permease protein